MLTSFSVLPLRIATILGILFSLFGFFIVILTIIEKISNPDIPQGYSSLVIIICFFSGIQLISIGLLGEYLGRIFIFLNKRPQYLIKEKFINSKKN